VTSAAPLLNVPHEQSDWASWSFQLDQNVRDITQALRMQRGVSLVEYQIFPIPEAAVGEWLERVSGVIGDICQELNVQSADIETVDLQDERERQAWVWQVFTEINAARGMLKI